MSYYLDAKNITANRYIEVDIPAPTNDGGFDYEIEFEVRVSGTELIINSTTTAGVTGTCFLKASVLEYRSPGNTNINMTHGVSIADWHKYRLVFTGTGQGNIAFHVDDDFKANYTPSSTIGNGSWLGLLALANTSRVGDFRYFKFTDRKKSPESNRMYDARAHVPGDTFLRETANNVNGVFSPQWLAVPPNFVADTPIVTPITFAGTIPNFTFTVGDIVSVNLTTGRFSGTETPFTFVNTGTLLTGTGLTISSAGLLSGTAAAGSSAAVVVTGTDAALNTAVSNAFRVTVNEAGPGTAYSIACDTAADSHSVGDITLTYTPGSFVTITLPPMYRNTNTATVGEVGFSFVNVIRESDGVEIASIAGLSTNASGVLSFTDSGTGAAIISGTVYLIAHRETTGQFGLTKVTAL